MKPVIASECSDAQGCAATDPRTAMLFETVQLLHMAMDQTRCAALEATATHGLTELHARVLRFLNVHGPTPMGELADHLGNDPASVTALVDRLEQRDLVARRSDPCDRRVRRIVLTPQGETKCQELHEGFAAAFPAQRLSVAQLRDLRDLLVAMVGEVPPADCDEPR